jgi:multicomponent K+:H+ antiporter subunit D
VGGLVLLLMACTVFAGPLSRYTKAAADQLLARKPLVDAVLCARPVPAAIDVRKEMRKEMPDAPGVKP